MILAAKKTVKEKKRVIANELVTVNVKGNKPPTFKKNNVKNKKKTKLTLEFFFCKILSPKMAVTKLNSNLNATKTNEFSKRESLLTLNQNDSNKATKSNKNT